MQIGTDLVEIGRIGRLIHEEKFLSRIYTLGERELAERMEAKRRVEFLAGRFAVKESVAKALGTGIGQGVQWKEIETLIGEKGEPYTRVTGQAFARMHERGLSRIQVSISHAGGFALAFVVLT
jgi:holo-[acyl-carrier protein] synthase